MQKSALALLLAHTRDLPIAALVGLPVSWTDCSTTARRSSAGGRLLGVVPKQYLPNYREFYELRQFTPGCVSRARRVDDRRADRARSARICSSGFAEQPKLVLSVEICEDLWVPAPPSSFAALAGATVIANLSASNVVVGKARVSPRARRQPVGALHRGVSLQRGWPR